MDNKKIGLFIASLRKEKGMTQKELADKLYISAEAVSKWERGLSMPDISLIEKLSNYLEVSVSEILKGEKIDDMTKKKSDEIVKTSVSFFQKEYFKNKVKFITLIVIASIVALCIIFYIIGTVDYIRAVNGKKPIFIYHTVTVHNPDANKEGNEYYGIGYKVILCDNKKDDFYFQVYHKKPNYIFELGHKQKNLCYSTLNCSETNGAKNDKHSYNFSFFDNKLYLINATFLIPSSSIIDEEALLNEYKEMNKVVGFHISLKRINETTYEQKQTCNIAKMLKAGSKNVCTIDYFSESDIYDLTKDQIDNYYYKDTCK